MTASEAHKEEKRNRLMAIITVVIVYALMLVCFLFLGLSYQVPPPPEYGIEVDMSGGGGGGSSGSIASTTTTQTVTSQPAQKIATQKTETTTAVPSGKESNVQPKTEPVPTVNENALFKSRAKQGGGEGSGQGSGTGSGIGPGSGSGSGGGSGAGYGSGDGDFWLDGRPVIKKAFPKSKTNLEGLVVVEFRADKSGNDIYAKAGIKGTTISDVDIWKECERAAKESKFKAKADASAEERGIIRYRFVIQ